MNPEVKVNEVKKVKLISSITMIRGWADESDDDGHSEIWEEVLLKSSCQELVCDLSGVPKLTVWPVLTRRN